MSCVVNVVVNVVVKVVVKKPSLIVVCVGMKSMYKIQAMQLYILYQTAYVRAARAIVAWGAWVFLIILGREKDWLANQLVLFQR